MALKASSCLIRAQIGPLRGVLPAQGVLALFLKSERSITVRPTG